MLHGAVTGSRYQCSTEGVNDLPGLAGPSLTCIATSYIGLSMAGLRALDCLCAHAKTSALRRGRASCHILMCLTCLQDEMACCGRRVSPRPGLVGGFDIARNQRTKPR